VGRPITAFGAKKMGGGVPLCLDKAQGGENFLKRFGERGEENDYLGGGEGLGESDS